jgi:hypothetical protein
MENDRLQLFNLKLCRQIRSLKEPDEFWNFAVERLDTIKNFERCDTEAFYALGRGMEQLEKSFRREVETDEEFVQQTLINDFCFEGEAVRLDYYARCGYLDSADSCRVENSGDVQTFVCKDSWTAHCQKYFHLLEAVHVEKIIRAMEKNFERLTVNKREDIDKIIKIRERCLKDEGCRAAYIYDLP